jgi:hypothetical protein
MRLQGTTGEGVGASVLTDINNSPGQVIQGNIANDPYWPLTGANLGCVRYYSVWSIFGNSQHRGGDATEWEVLGVIELIASHRC